VVNYAYIDHILNSIHTNISQQRSPFRNWLRHWWKCKRIIMCSWCDHFGHRLGKMYRQFLYRRKSPPLNLHIDSFHCFL